MRTIDSLVTDVQHRAVVAGLRGLGRRGHGALALAPRRTAAGLWSRYAAGRAVGPDPGRDPAGFVRSVGELAKARGPLVLFPGTEDSIGAVLRHRSELPPEAFVPYPPSEAVQALRDKSRLPELAGAAGFGAPVSLAETTAGSLASVSTPMPYVVKPSRPDGHLRGAYVITGPRDVEWLVARAATRDDERVLVQEWVRGPLTSIEIVLDREGRVVDRFQHLTARTWPPSAGSISYATSVVPEEELVAKAADLLRHVGYWGLAQLDLVQGDSELRVIDVNPRFYSCLPLSLACGVNLPAAWHDVATRSAASHPSSYRTGVSFRWLEGDLLAVASGRPSRFLRPAPSRAVGAMWAADDPVPGALLGLGVVGSRLRRRASGAGRGGLAAGARDAARE